MPAQNHVFVEAMVLEEIGPLDQLEIARAIVKYRFCTQHDLVEMKRATPGLDCLNGKPRLLTIKSLPQRLGNLEPRRMIEPWRQIAGDFVERLSIRLGHKNHVGVGRQY